MLKRVLYFVIIVELFYLLVFNAVLNTEVTQKLINKIKPQKFQITWQKAWTPYPFKVFIEDASVWGASSSQKWKVNVHSASASISLFPLLKHRVKVYDIDAVDVDYFQRPVKVDVGKSDLEEFFAAMNSTEDASHTEKSIVTRKNKVKTEKPEKEEKKAWKIDLDNIVAKGQHSFWIMHAKGDFDGNVNVDRMRIETNSGPFSVENGTLDILMKSLQIGKEKEMLTQSKIKGNIDIDPIVFSQNKGMKMLSFFSFETDISSQMGNLDVLDIYLHRFKEASLDGKGKLDGHINFHKGKLLPNTDLKVNADKLSLSVMNYNITGNGKVQAKVTKDNPEILDAKVIFDELHTYFLEEEVEKENVLLFKGHGLTVHAKGEPSLLDDNDTALKYLSAEIPTVSVDDIAVFQRYIPKKWAFKLYEGSGELHAKAALEKEHVSFNLQLLSKEAKVGLSKQVFKSDLDLLLKFDATLGKAFKADMSGSYLSLKDSVIVDGSGKKKKTSKNWDTYLSIDESIFTMPLDEDKNLSREDLRSMDKLDLKKLLSTADATLKVTGMISQFDWLNLLMKNSLNLSFAGMGEIEADLKLKQGLLTEGSKISVIPQNLEVGLLDYSFMGDGHFLFNVTQGGETPSMKFDLSLNDAQMKRRNEKQAMIEHVNVKLDGEIKDLDLKKSQKEVDLHLHIPSAKVKNIAVYNSYIPKNSPFKLTKGTADMSADIILSANDAKGYVKLKTHGLTMQADDQKISARLNMDVKIQGGVPKNMAFNIAGSTIVLDQARIIGDTTNYKQPDWSAKVNLKKANVVWRKPIKLKSETTLHIKDSRPIVAMMDNKRDKHNWLSKLMTIENINGTATVNMQNNILTFPYAFVKSDKIDIGAKGIISEALRDGVFYLRYKRLKTLLKIRNGKKNLDIFNVEKTFNSYRVPKH